MHGVMLEENDGSFYKEIKSILSGGDEEKKKKRDRALEKYVY
jgi:hypothetical protein